MAGIRTNRLQFESENEEIMTTGTKLTLNLVAYTVDLVGPVTTLLIRGDGAFVHADTKVLRYCLEQDK